MATSHPFASICIAIQILLYIAIVATINPHDACVSTKGAEYTVTEANSSGFAVLNRSHASSGQKYRLAQANIGGGCKLVHFQPCNDDKPDCHHWTYCNNSFSSPQRCYACHRKRLQRFTAKVKVEFHCNGIGIAQLNPALQLYLLTALKHHLRRHCLPKVKPCGYFTEEVARVHMTDKLAEIPVRRKVHKHRLAACLGSNVISLDLGQQQCSFAIYPFLSTNSSSLANTTTTATPSTSSDSVFGSTHNDFTTGLDPTTTTATTTGSRSASTESSQHATTAAPPTLTTKALSSTPAVVLSETNTATIETTSVATTAKVNVSSQNDTTSPCQQSCPEGQISTQHACTECVTCPAGKYKYNQQQCQTCTQRSDCPNLNFGGGLDPEHPCTPSSNAQCECLAGGSMLQTCGGASSSAVPIESIVVGGKVRCVRRTNISSAAELEVGCCAMVAWLHVKHELNPDFVHVHYTLNGMSSSLSASPRHIAYVYRGPEPVNSSISIRFGPGQLQTVLFQDLKAGDRLGWARSNLVDKNFHADQSSGNQSGMHRVKDSLQLVMIESVTRGPARGSYVALLEDGASPIVDGVLVSMAALATVPGPVRRIIDDVPFDMDVLFMSLFAPIYRSWNGTATILAARGATASTALQYTGFKAQRDVYPEPIHWWHQAQQTCKTYAELLRSVITTVQGLRRGQGWLEQSFRS
eukprot:TRINITY_DN6104_c0_g1_i1.p1 TRINITY_DN6104_c0_g1~~TRINITY_DN6104_c0_g1_i1.p1  ORF type:complete len:695 (+),score=100.64 TRINITY_DN6104_c0_g1_i1:387-2471(+)